MSGLFGSPIVISQADDLTLNNAPQIVRQLCEFYYDSPAFQIKLDTIERKQLFKQGDQLGFIFSATQDAYFMLLSIDPLYNMSIIYPYTASEIKKIAAHTPYQLDNAGIVQGPYFGQERIKVFAFKQKPPSFALWAGRYWKSDSPDNQAFMKLIQQAAPFANQSTLTLWTCKREEYKKTLHNRAQAFQQVIDAKTLTRGIMVMPYIHIPIHFEYNKSQLNPSGIQQAEQLGKALRNDVFRQSKFRIIGHTDSRGSHAYNQLLSEKRALAVKQYLMQEFSIPSIQLQTEGKGETELLYHEPSEDAHALNRRVEIKLD